MSIRICPVLHGAVKSAGNGGIEKDEVSGRLRDRWMQQVRTMSVHICSTGCLQLQKTCTFECSHTGSPIITPWEVHFCGNMIVLLVGKVNLYSDNHYLVMDNAWMILPVRHVPYPKTPAGDQDRQTGGCETGEALREYMEHERLYENKLLACPSSKYEYREHRSKNCLDKIVVEDDTEFSIIKCDMMVKETSSPRWG
ncbi:hypothetical protein WUBG_00043 [Wuchereria bancrofti]|uniref:Uncharacterized protein n=1 Tax=Wuchereria bancrofti TaxID=6293 RepID=J9BNB7_WUCBA|nr:hypothetical protein WUBG_00043 [Wuchereria bancrofti]